MNRTSRYYIFAAILLSILTTLRFAPVLGRNNLSVGAGGGDSVGTMGIIGNFTSDVSTHGLSLLMGDRYATDRFGLGVITPYAINPFWKIQYYVSGKLFDAREAYDEIAFVGLLGVGLSFLWIMFVAEVTPLVALVLAVLFLGMVNFERRLGGHLGLAIPSLPLLLVGAACLILKRPTQARNWVFGAAVGVLNFMQNEYYGYFGFIFMTALILVGLIGRYREWSVRVLRAMIVGFVAFCVAFIAAYPSILKALLIKNVSGTTSSDIQNYFYSRDDFLAYSLVTTRDLFATQSAWLHKLGFPASTNQSYGFEMSFAVGTLLPVGCIFLCFLNLALFFKWRKRHNDQASSVRSHWIFVLTFALASFFICLWGVSPVRYPHGSLVPITIRFAPMFRIGVRCFLYTQIGLLMLLALAATETWRRSGLFTDAKLRYALRGLVIGLLALVGADITAIPFWKPYESFSLPAIEDYAILKNRSKGWLIELPVGVPLEQPPETSYVALYHQIAHGQPTLNTFYHPPHNTKYMNQFQHLFRSANHPSEQFLKCMANLGLKYVVVERGNENIRRQLELSSSFEAVVDKGGPIAIFQSKLADVPPEVAKERMLKEWIDPGKAKPCGLSF